MTDFPVPRLVVGAISKPLGVIEEPADLPELLRFAADYYDDNPDACERLFLPPTSSVPRNVAAPFRHG